MQARRCGVLVVGGLFGVVVASCSSGADRAGHGPSTVVPGTVLLSATQPEFLDAMAAAVGSPNVVVPRLVRTIAVPVERPTMPVERPPSTTANPPPALRHAVFAFTGDTLIHSPLVEQAAENAAGAGNGSIFDFSPMYAEVAPILSAADYSICHLESPIAPPGERLSTFPVYGIPAEIAPALAGAGYDRCSTASNHTIDRGTAGIDATVNALEAAGVTEAGMARTPEEAVVQLVEVNGIEVAHLSYTFGLNGAHLPPDQPWRSNLIDADQIIWAAADARARGADVVILSLHWGSEGQSAITPYQLRVADAVTRAGVVDLIVGHHVHVIQPIEKINGTWVVFGMGNFLSNMPTGSFSASSQDGMIVSVGIHELADTTFTVDPPTVIPTWVDRTDGFVIRPVIADLADPAVDARTKDQLYDSLQRTGAVVGAFIAG